MSADLELNDWRTEWLAQDEPSRISSADVRRDAIRKQRRRRILHVLELFSGVIFVGGSAAVAWKFPSAECYLWAGIVWLTTLIVSAFSVWNWQVLWKADLRSVAEFAEEYEKRCLAEIRAARFGKGFIIVQAMISVPWFIWDYHRGEFSTARFGGALLFVLLLCVGFWVMFYRYRRAALSTLEGIREAEDLR
jgi:hypothetical protein